MPRIEFADAVAEDVDRIVSYLESRSNGDATARIGEIVEALQVLQRHPLMGRAPRNGTRELVLGRPGRGYVALYKYVPEADMVFVPAIRSQREAGYAR